VAYLPRYARWASALRGLVNLRNTVPALAWAMERTVGIAARRSLPAWTKPFDTRPRAVGPEGGRAVVLLADTFNTRFEPENLDAALAVLTAAGCRVHVVGAADGGRPLCCGRTFLSAGLVEEAKAEARRTMAALMPFVDQGAAVVGLEPSCLLTLRDEYLAMGLGGDSERFAASAMLFEEFLAAEADAGRLALDLKALPGSRALLHGHCHQKAFAAMGAVERALALVPGLEVETVASSCCGMAGAFGYQAETYDISQAMGELSLLPIMRAASADAIIVADGTSCRHQIADGTGRRARHVAVVLREALR
jgi:Fe-S oxidoreductase